MADLNPAPRAGGVEPPPPVNLDPAPAGSFQANRALNGKRGIAARQQAPHTAGPDETELPQFQSPGVASHSARFRRDSGLEGGGTGVSRGRGPVPLSSPDSMVGALVVACPGTVGARVGFCWDCWCPLSLCSLGLLVPVLCDDLWSRRVLAAFVCWHSDFSEWGGIEGEVRVHASLALGPPIELRSTRVVSAPQLPALVAEPAASREVEQFQAASHSQSRQEVLASVESPDHEKVAQTRFAAVSSPHCVTSQEDGGRAAVRYSGHLRRRSKSADPMDVEPVTRFLDADPVEMLTSVNPVVVKVLADGWQEPIPLGHFARCFNPLMSGYSSGELSTLRMGENGQRNFPQAIREYLVPPGQKYAGSEVAQATADMVKGLFVIMEEHYPDFPLHRPQDTTFESIYREWRECEDEREKEKERLWAQEKVSGQRGDAAGSSSYSHAGFGGGSSSPAHQGSRGGRGFHDYHDSRRHQASASDYLKRDNEGIYRDAAGKRVCFSWNGTKGCDFKPCQKGEHSVDFPITTRLKADEWVRVLGEAGVLDQFSDVLEGIANGFDIGVDRLSISHTFIPPNHFKTEVEAAVVREK
ncbi:hypothetical protein C8R42DRAFT_637409 [Lentinula raphanica]|nr:hypothetical protein C8R42DRAFT_637409 [Lentinula raphanica]